jgi:hypothetical protein
MRDYREMTGLAGGTSLSRALARAGAFMLFALGAIGPAVVFIATGAWR